MPKYVMLATVAGAALVAGSTAQAQDYYIQGNVGAVFMGDSSNSGDVNENFVLGLDQGTLTSDAAYRFESDFEIGGFFSLAIGKTTSYGPFRSELEFSYSRNDVQDHDDLQALGADLSGLDVGALLGAEDEVGVTIGRVLEDAQGEVTTIAAMVNSYYDITVPNERVHPYVGVGIGVMRINVEYDPSGLDFVDDDEVNFAYQAMLGVDYDLTDTRVLHAGFRYRGAQTAEVSTGGTLGLDSDLDVDVDQFIAEIGYRVSF
ncbi:outer membrane protein [Parvularcula maris]|uniref:P44/Msp2 family outer membrane protein n=1 Tax=Parvularcula maris TaxID=2965077 RepID=A0A9X2RHH7_9PROT|nr:OmpW family outer membrane protein [Parvularcula maris]MCQ8183901.1 P44/Msp2 family outer membrane protein [Parvularcula maris]